MYKNIDEENGIDDHDHYGDPDVPRSDDLYRRCKHNNIANECWCEDDVGQYADGDIYDDLDDGFFRA